MLNGAALRVVGYTKDTPDPPAGEIVRDAHGNPTAMAMLKRQVAITPPPQWVRVVVTAHQFAEKRLPGCVRRPSAAPCCSSVRHG
jgi:predicted amidohydrolase YtcJ